MAAKKKAPQKTITRSELIKALTEAGYEIEGFGKKQSTLVVRLKPASLLNDAGGFVALDVCDANNLQARCTVFAALPQDLLILSVKMPEAGRASAVTPHEKEPAK